jgi:hypothetical protein
LRHHVSPVLQNQVRMGIPVDHVGVERGPLATIAGGWPLRLLNSLMPRR